jgi:hypothetical protein
MTQADNYIFWRGALKEDYPYPMQDGKFECGFWRTKNRDKSWSAVAIWKDGEDLKILVNSTLVEPEKFAQRWNFTWQSPVTKEAYDEFRQTGLWPGEVAGIGHNTPDEFTELKENIEDQAAQVLKWLADLKELTNDRDADKAANYRDSLNKLHKKADERRKEEKEPLARQVKEIDSKYGAIVKTAKDAADTVRDALTRFMRRKEAEENARIAAERKAAEAERKRQEAERRALEDQDIALAALEPPPAPTPEPEAPRPIRVGGQLGRATGFRTVHKAKITDYRKALDHFAEHPDVRAVIEKLCNSEARSRTRKDIPGVEFVEERVAA